jgi:hypothetical protein
MFRACGTRTAYMSSRGEMKISLKLMIWIALGSLFEA